MRNKKILYNNKLKRKANYVGQANSLPDHFVWICRVFNATFLIFICVLCGIFLLLLAYTLCTISKYK